MTLRSIEPEPCIDVNYHEQLAPPERVMQAMNLCRTRGVRLTKLRRQVLELLWESARPAGAYEMIDALEVRNSRQVAPPTVYRALEFLITQGFASKIVSRNAYVACAHPERRHDRVFLICGDCEGWVELEDPQLERQLAEDAAHRGFRATQRVVEVLGKCANCTTPGAA